MSMACGHPQGSHMEACGQGRGQKPLFICGHHKWMTPK